MVFPDSTLSFFSTLTGTHETSVCATRNDATFFDISEVVYLFGLIHASHLGDRGGSCVFLCDRLGAGLALYLGSTPGEERNCFSSPMHPARFFGRLSLLFAA